MLPCIHRTEPIGSVVQQCCGGQQKRYDLRLCESDQQPHRYCSWQLTTGGMSAIEHDGISEISHVTSCHRCPYAERPFIPATDIPKAQALPKMQNRSVQLWMELRARRTGDRAAEQLFPLVYCSRLGCVRELHADELRQREPEPLPRLDIVKRHLMYHVWPLSKARYVWQKNLARIKTSLPLFNGTRCVGVALDTNTDSLEDVRAILGDNVEYLTVDNNQHGEMNSFPRLLAKVNTTEKGHVTFYAHAKGVKYHADPHATPHLWTNIMYETCLDYLPWVDALLHDHVFAGTFKKIGRKFGASSSAWHYSGTFYWFRNRDIFSRNWNVADHAYWGSESWPGKVSTAKEGGSLFMAADSGHLNVYGVDVWHHHILPYLDTWREIHEDMRTHAR